MRIFQMLSEHAHSYFQLFSTSLQRLPGLSGLFLELPLKFQLLFKTDTPLEELKTAAVYND